VLVDVVEDDVEGSADPVDEIERIAGEECDAGVDPPRRRYSFARRTLSGSPSVQKTFPFDPMALANQYAEYPNPEPSSRTLLARLVRARIQRSCPPADRRWETIVARRSVPSRGERLARRGASRFR